MNNNSKYKKCVKYKNVGRMLLFISFEIIIINTINVKDVHNVQMCMEYIII